MLDEEPEFDLRLRDEPEPAQELEQPLLVWPGDDTPRMGRAARAAYLAFIVLLAIGAVWVIKRDVEGPVAQAGPQASEEAVPAVDNVDDLPSIEVDPPASIELPTGTLPEPNATPDPGSPPVPPPAGPPLAAPDATPPARLARAPHRRSRTLGVRIGRRARRPSNHLRCHRLAARPTIPLHLHRLA